MRRRAFAALRPNLSFLLPPRTLRTRVEIHFAQQLPSQAQPQTTCQLRRCQSTYQRSIPRQAPGHTTAVGPASAAPPAPPAAGKKPQIRRNEEITTPFVQLIDETTKKLGSPEPIAAVFSKVDTTQFDLVELKPGVVRLVPARPKSESSATERGVVVNNTRTRMSKASKKKAASGGITLKTLELSYAIDKHDLSHRLGKLQEFLQKGFRVDVVLAKKKGSRNTTLDERKETLLSIKKAVDDVGGFDFAGPEGTVERGVVRLHVQGKKPA